MKKIVSALLAIVLLFAFSSVAHAQITKDQYYARSFLSGNELELYDLIYDYYENGEGHIDLNALDVTKVRADEINWHVQNDAPELFRESGIYSGEEAQELQKQIDKAADEILTVIKGDMTDYEKVKALYNAVGRYIYYGYGTNEKDEKPIRESQTVVGGLVNKKAVCGGIARTLQYLLYQIDIPCYSVVGANNSGAHSWNTIQIDGQWYYADLTYDIANVKRGDPWEAFLISDETLHSFGTYANADNPPLPECPEDYKAPQPAPTPAPAQAEPIKANIPDEPEQPAEDFAKSQTQYYLLVIPIAIVAILLMRRKKKNA